MRGKFYITFNKKEILRNTKFSVLTWTALAMAELETVRFLLMISSNSGSDRPWGTLAFKGC